MGIKDFFRNNKVYDSTVKLIAKKAITSGPKQIGKNIGEAIGMGVGAGVGGPAGAAIGGFAGKNIGGMIAKSAVISASKPVLEKTANYHKSMSEVCSDINEKKMHQEKEKIFNDANKNIEERFADKKGLKDTIRDNISTYKDIIGDVKQGGKELWKVASTSDIAQEGGAKKTFNDIKDVVSDLNGNINDKLCNISKSALIKSTLSDLYDKEREI